LHHYKIELQHLNPNEIQPQFELWKYFIAVSLQKKREKHKAELSVLMGCTNIHL
jgi:hypothetical protein